MMLQGIPDVMPNFTEREVANECWRWGRYLWVPDSISGPHLLWALGGCESSFGLNCQPRHEAAYCTGAYSHTPQIVKLTGDYGHGAHCSYGPWQILLVNCGSDPAPHDLMDISRAAMETVTFINRRILKGEKAITVAEIADAYNSGDWRDRIVPEKYIADCLEYYGHKPLPGATDGKA